MEQFCYSIYDPVNQPYLNIMQLFGDVEENLRHGRYICHECLYIIRWMYFMKKILADALLDDDIGENDRVIPAFNIFKVKINHPVFLLDEDGCSENEDDDEQENNMSSSMQVQCLDSEDECRSPRNLQDYEYFNGGLKIAQRQPTASQVPLADGNSNWCLTQQVGNTEVGSCSQRLLNSGENRLMQYSCNINVCRHTCDTFNELKNHYQLHHLNEQMDLTLESYGKQLQEYNKTHAGVANQRRKKFRCLLSHCRKAFKSLESLSEHKVKEHNLLAKFWCVECYNLPFISRDDLNQHSSFFHSHDNIIQRSLEYPCKYCDKYFLEKNLLSAHQLKHHYLQFIKQSEVKLKSQTSIVKKIEHNSVESSTNCNKTIKNGVCYFKMRRQKEITLSKERPDVSMKWLKFKYPHFDSKPLTNNILPKVDNPLGASDRGKEKVLISLPPRKRRQYQAAIETLAPASIDSHPAVISEIKENVSQISNTLPVVETHQPNKVLELPKIDSKAETSLVESTKLPVNDESSHTPINMTVPDKIEISSQEEQIQLINSIEANSIESVEKLYKNNCINNVADPLKLTNNDLNVNAPVIAEDEKDAVIPSEVPEVKVDLPLKTYNCRKRKRPHQNKSKTSTSIKKTKQLSENKPQGSHEPKACKHSGSMKEDSLVPQVVSKIEEKDNDNNTGRITMTISLKAIKQYTNNKEEKRESKRQKKLKEKKKGKKDPAFTSEQTTSSKPIKESIINAVVNDNAKLESTSNEYIPNDVHVPASEACPIFQALDETSSVTSQINVITEVPETNHIYRDISESENESRHDIILNKDEINMIIFGETLNTNGISNDIPLANEQIVDVAAEEVSSTEKSNGQLDISPPTVAKLPKKKNKSKSRIGKKRKIKRKPDKILKLSMDADGKVIDNQQLQKPPCIGADTEGEDTVEGQISNVQLKDHLYARSAFNAFKNSK